MVQVAPSLATDSSGSAGKKDPLLELMTHGVAASQVAGSCGALKLLARWYGSN